MDLQQKPTGMAETAHRKLIISLLSQSICIPDTFCWSLITRHNSAQYCTLSYDIQHTDGDDDDDVTHHSSPTITQLSTAHHQVI